LNTPVDVCFVDKIFFFFIYASIEFNSVKRIKG